MKNEDDGGYNFDAKGDDTVNRFMTRRVKDWTISTYLDLNKNFQTLE